MFQLSPVSGIIAEHQKSAPVKVIALAHALGLKVYTSMTLSDNVSGLIRKDGARGGDSGFAIFINGNHAETRRRFTIAHEIAHYILHEEFIGDGIVEDALMRSDKLNSSVERQANSLAADILMPWHLIDKAKKSGTRTIEDLAVLFKVSRDAMSFRVLGTSYESARQNDIALTHYEDFDGAPG